MFSREINWSEGFPNMVLSTEYSEAVNARYTFQPLGVSAITNNITLQPRKNLDKLMIGIFRSNLSNLIIRTLSLCGVGVVHVMGLIRAAAILAIDNRFRTLSLELKSLGTSFGGAKQKFLIPRDSTWPPCD